MPEIHAIRERQRDTDESRTYLDLDCAVQSLLLLGGPSLGLCTHNTTTPVSPAFLIFVMVSILDGLDELGQL